MRLAPPFCADTRWTSPVEFPVKRQRLRVICVLRVTRSRGLELVAARRLVGVCAIFFSRFQRVTRNVWREEVSDWLPLV